MIGVDDDGEEGVERIWENMQVKIVSKFFVYSGELYSDYFRL
jgi:hypothetical protein